MKLLLRRVNKKNIPRKEKKQKGKKLVSKEELYFFVLRFFYLSPKAPSECNCTEGKSHLLQEAASGTCWVLLAAAAGGCQGSMGSMQPRWEKLIPAEQS